MREVVTTPYFRSVVGFKVSLAQTEGSIRAIRGQSLKRREIMTTTATSRGAVLKAIKGAVSSRTGSISRPALKRVAMPTGG